MQRPPLTIITITLNDGPRLARAVESVDSQKGRETFEHIIVNSGKPLRERSFPRAKIIDIPAQGVYKALNAGIREAGGEVICMVHGNDRLIEPGICRRMLDEFTKNPDLDFIYGDIVYKNHRGSLRKYNSGSFTPASLIEGYAPAHPSLFVRRSVFKKVGLYNSAFRIAGDFEMWLRLFDPANGLKYAYIPICTTEMATGGISQLLLNRIFITMPEKRRALRMHSLPANFLRLLLRTKYFFK